MVCFIGSLRIRILIYRVEFWKPCLYQRVEMLHGKKLMTLSVLLFLLKNKFLGLLLHQEAKESGTTMGGFGFLQKVIIESIA